MPRKHIWDTLDNWKIAPRITRVIPDDMNHVGMLTHIILCVDLYSWVGEEEEYDGCVAT